MTDVVRADKLSSYDAHPVIRAHVDNVVKLVERALPIARKLLDFSPEIEVVLKNTDLANAYYAHDPRRGRVVINPKRCHTLKLALVALMHELVHAEQFKQGRLEISLTRSRRVVMKWMGSVVVQETRDYEKYRAQPWEAEAFGREKELVNAVIERLRERGQLWTSETP